MLLEYSGYNRMLWIYSVQGSVTKIIPVYRPVQRLGGRGDVTILSPFWEEMARK